MSWPFTNNKYPTVQYPTVLEGVIHSDRIRYESLDGSELILVSPDPVTIFKNFLPFERDGKMWGLSHLQKYSSRGWLKMSPDCYHQWYFWKPQEQNEKGDWIPDSERGIYFRRPFSWRWDIAGTVLDGALRHWVWTKGYIGGHWD